MQCTVYVHVASYHLNCPSAWSSISASSPLSIILPALYGLQHVWQNDPFLSTPGKVSLFSLAYTNHFNNPYSFHAFIGHTCADKTRCHNPKYTGCPDSWYTCSWYWPGRGLRMRLPSIIICTQIRFEFSLICRIETCRIRPLLFSLGWPCLWIGPIRQLVNESSLNVS